jgi:acetyltransferase
MTIRNLQHLFHPSSVAVVGASDRAGSVGATVMHNLLNGGFSGAIVPVNPNHGRVAGLKTLASVSELTPAPELAVICTPARSVPDIIRELGARGTKAAIVLSGGIRGQTDERGRPLAQLMLEAARPHLLRILGPNCVGLLVPGIGLNASFAHIGARRGKLAFVSQSGALTTALLDWADERRIGFSHFISLGDSADVDFGDVLDYLATDRDTSAILLYIESISHARKFMSAARAAARNKPVIAVKSGRAPESASAAASHTGALAGSDDVYDAALRRAGILRVDSTLELFDAAESLALARPSQGDRLAILTNGGGPGVMAADALIRGGGKLATLSDQTRAQLDALLPASWSHGNPVDIIGDAPAQRYRDALRLLLADTQSDAVLMIHAPTAIVGSASIAQTCLPALRDTSRNFLSCWMGGTAVESARALFAGAGLPTYDTPEQAVDAFLQMTRYHRNQEILAQIPPSAPVASKSGVVLARGLIETALAAGRSMLDEVDAKEALRACGIPVLRTRKAASVEAAGAIASELGYPVALKILSPDISHKSDVGGVALNLQSEKEVRDAAHAMQERITHLRPQARLDGFTVQPMLAWPDAHELIFGAATDPTFGPVILFGQGGTSVEVIGDRALALPPLNMVLAQELVSRTRVAKVLAAHRDKPAADMDSIYRLLIQVAQFMAELPQVMELDLNPVLANAGGVMALDARIRIGPAACATGAERLAIRPYPSELEQTLNIGGRKLWVRPIRPEDEIQLRRLVMQCKPEDRHFRFFGAVLELPHSLLGRYTQIDYDREMAFVALNADNELLGEVRTVTDPDNASAEFAILVGSEFQAKGLGYALLDKMIRYCSARGTGLIYGDILASNVRMLQLAQALGFQHASGVVGGIIRVKRDLAAPQAGAPAAQIRDRNDRNAAVDA